MIVDLVDGTYELYRQFYGRRRFNQGEDKPYGAVLGVLHSVLEMIEKGATHLGVATDHVIESFRNDLCPGTRRARESSPRSGRSSQSWRRRWSRWEWWSGRWWSWRRTTRWPRRRGWRRRTRRWSRSASGPTTRTWGSAFGAAEWCRWTAEPGRFGMRRRSRRSSGSSPG